MTPGSALNQANDAAEELEATFKGNLRAVEAGVDARLRGFGHRLDSIEGAIKALRAQVSKQCVPCA